MHDQTREGHCFPVKHRLKSRKTIDRLFKEGRYQSRGFLKFRSLMQTRGYLRVVITVSKRVGNAPDRNRLKRLIREALRLSGYLRSKSFDCALFVTKPLKKEPSLVEIQEMVAYLLSQLTDEST